jgi:hypothetical protein
MSEHEPVPTMAHMRAVAERFLAEGGRDRQAARHLAHYVLALTDYVADSGNPNRRPCERCHQRPWTHELTKYGHGAYVLVCDLCLPVELAEEPELTELCR